MKNIIKLAFGFVALTLVSVACVKEQNPYTPGEVPNNSQVYFSSEESVGSLAPDQTTLAINVYRVDTKGEITVGVTAEDENDLFTFPTEVKFANGSNKAEYNIGIPFDEIEADVEYPISLTISNDQATPYGVSKLNLTIKYSPWSEWSLYKIEPATGIGDYTYSQMFTGVDPELEIYYSQSMLNPNLYQFKIPNWCYGVDLCFTYDASKTAEEGNVEVADQYTGYDHSSYGAVNVMESKNYGGKLADYPSSYFDTEAGIFYFNVVYYVSAGYFGAGFETFKLAGFYTPDYEVSANYSGLFQSKDGEYKACIDVLLGKEGKSVDIEEAKIVIVKGNDPAEGLKAIMAGSEDVITVTSSAEYRVDFPEGSEEGGNFCVVIAAYSEGEMVNATYDTFEAYFGGNPWESIGYCTYTEDVVGPLYKAPNVTYSVEVLVNEKKPGIYRMKNPYGELYPLNEEGDYEEGNVFVDIDASTDDQVFIADQYLGLNWGDGAMGMMSMAYYKIAYAGATVEEVKAEGLFGKLVDEVITFPTKGLLAFFDGDSNLYYSNKNGLFKLDMSNPTEKPIDPIIIGGNTNLSRSFNAAELVKGQSRGNNSKRFSKVIVAKDLIN